MATKAISTKGLKLQRGDGATPTETFTTVGEVTNLKGPSEKAAHLDATSFDSTGMEYINGLSDGGEVAFDHNFVGDDIQQQQLRADLRSGARRNFKIILNDMGSVAPTSVLFSALVTSAPELSGGVNSVLKSACTLKVTGLPVWTYRS